MFMVHRMMVMMMMMIMMSMTMRMKMMMMTNLGKKVPHDLILVAAFLVGGSHIVRHVEDVPEKDKDHHHNQDEDVDHHHHQDGEDGDEVRSMIFSRCPAHGGCS